MSVTIQSLGVAVSGQLVKHYDKGADKTTLSLNAEQARELHQSLGSVVDYFDAISPRVRSVEPSNGEVATSVPAKAPAAT